MARATSWLDLRWLVGCVLTLAVASASATSRGYLARLGPIPLRFQEPPLPALVLRPGLPAPSEPSPSAPSSPPTVAARASEALPLIPPEWQINSDDPGILNGAAVTATNAEPASFITLPNSNPAGASAIISPQVLLELFRPRSGGTNGAAAVLVPVQFRPPEPLVPSSSRATYRVQ